jgi:hypothetical protein
VEVPSTTWFCSSQFVSEDNLSISMCRGTLYSSCMRHYFGIEVLLIVLLIFLATTELSSGSRTLC